MVILLQNQPRYQLLILPPLVACIMLLLRELVHPKAMVKLLVLCTSCFFAADVYLLSRVRSDIRVEAHRQQFVGAALASAPLDARYAVIDQNRGLMKLVISRLSPAPGLMVDPRYIEKDNLAKVVALYKPEYVISSMVDLPDNFVEKFQPWHQEYDSDGDSQITVCRLRDN